MSTWKDTETPLAKDILEFVNRECGGVVAWIKKREDGRYETNAESGGMLVGPLLGNTEEECAMEYFRFYRRRISFTLNSMSLFSRYITQREKFAKMTARAAKWDAWAKRQNIPEKR